MRRLLVDAQDRGGTSFLLDRLRVSHGAVTDIYAHLGGTLAGTTLVFFYSAIWEEDKAEPPRAASVL